MAYSSDPGVHLFNAQEVTPVALLKKYLLPFRSKLQPNVSSITQDLLVSLLHTQEQDGVILRCLPENAKSGRLKVGRFGANLQVGETRDKYTTTHTILRKFGGMGRRHIRMEEAGIYSDSYTEESENIVEFKLQLLNFGMTLEQAIGRQFASENNRVEWFSSHGRTLSLRSLFNLQ